MRVNIDTFSIISLWLIYSHFFVRWSSEHGDTVVAILSVLVFLWLWGPVGIISFKYIN